MIYLCLLLCQPLFCGNCNCSYMFIFYLCLLLYGKCMLLLTCPLSRRCSLHAYSSFALTVIASHMFILLYDCPSHVWVSIVIHPYSYPNIHVVFFNLCLLSKLCCFDGKRLWYKFFFSSIRRRLPYSLKGRTGKTSFIEVLFCIFLLLCFLIPKRPK